MPEIEAEKFNVTQRRPRVLLVGNGLSHDSGVSWNELVDRASNSTARNYADIDMKNGKIKCFRIPSPLVMMVCGIVDDKDRHAAYLHELEDFRYDQNPLIERLVGLDFDAILTTNYTYEFENAILPGYSRLKDETKQRKAVTTKGRKDSKYLLYTRNRPRPDKPQVWHLHGEVRRKNSLILSHDEYVRMVGMLTQHNKERGGDYRFDQKNLAFESWIDYLIMGDVYILGLSLDFSEIDLWWALNRRKREKSGCGVCRFYTIKKDEKLYIDRDNALRDLGVEVDYLDGKPEADWCEKSDNAYQRFYKKTITDMQKRITLAE